MCMLQKDADEGPMVKARFKITKKRFTDWVGMILGAKAIDHPSRGGLGHIPAANGH